MARRCERVSTHDERTVYRQTEANNYIVGIIFRLLISFYVSYPPPGAVRAPTRMARRGRTLQTESDVGMVKVEVDGEVNKFPYSGLALIIMDLMGFFCFI